MTCMPRQARHAACTCTLVASVLLDDIKLTIELIHLMEKKTYSKLSFVFSLVSTVIVGYFLSLLPSKIGVNEFVPAPSPFIVVATTLTSILGFLFTVLSFARQEPSSPIKWIGGSINTVIFLLIVGSVVFSIIV